MFQGQGRKDNYFEGWYYKLVDKKLDNVFAVIPGISIKDNDRDTHAFIQVLDGKNAVSSYYDFSCRHFTYSKKGFDISIGKNHFSGKGMYLDIERGGIRADIRFENTAGWPVRIFSPGAMGWYSFVPYMECYHGVLSMDHDLKGFMEIDKKEIDFGGGKGYIEKDWGTSFPEGWIWLQTNNFTSCQPCSLMLSIARIPWRGKSFTGFIGGFLYRGDFHIFATYNGSRLEGLSYGTDGGVSVELTGKGRKLKIYATRKKSARLASPVMGAMDGRIDESMDAEIRVSLSRSGRVVMEDCGRCGGFEMVRPQVLDV